MKRLWLLAWWLLVQASAWGQWQGLAPGGGGNILSVGTLPQNNQTIYVAALRAGLWRSTTQGSSWQATGQRLLHGTVLSVAVHASPNTLLAGTPVSTELSEDGGNSWRAFTPLAGRPAGLVAINPRNPSEWWVAEGLPEGTQAEVTRWQIPAVGPRQVHFTADRGQTWQTQSYTAGDGDRTLYGLIADTTQPGRAWLAASAGLFRRDGLATAWAQIPLPDGSFGVRSIALAPDGQTLYAACLIDSDSTDLFALRLSTNTWQAVSRSGFNPANRKAVWQLRMDPASSANNHLLWVTATAGDVGLQRGQYTWTGSQWQSTWEEVLAPGRSPDNADWSAGEPTAQRVFFGGQRGEQTIWLQGTRGQLWQARQDAATFPANFVPVHTRFVRSRTIGGSAISFWQTTGLSLHQPARIVRGGAYAAQADPITGLWESWDYGQSWTRQLRPAGTRGASAVALSPSTIPVVLVGAVNAQGQHGLYAKRGTSEQAPWQLIAGGSNGLSGVPNAPVTDIVINPTNPDEIFFCVQGRGIFRIPQLSTQFNAPAVALPKLTTATPLDNQHVSRLLPDLTVGDTLFAAVQVPAWQGLYRLVRQNADTWSWERLLLAQAEDVALFSLTTASGTGNAVPLMLTAAKWDPSTDGTLTGGDTLAAVLLASWDKGRNWQRILRRQDALQVNGSLPDWAGAHTDMRGLGGFRNRLYVSVQSDRFDRSLGLLEGFVADNNQIAWQQFGQGMASTSIGHLQVRTEGDTTSLLACTSAGAWRRALVIENTTGIAEDVAARWAMKVWPNPADRRWFVSFDNPTEQTFAPVLCDVSGRAVRQLEQRRCAPGPQTWQLEAPGLAPGLYVLRIGPAAIRVLVGP